MTHGHYLPLQEQLDFSVYSVFLGRGHSGKVKGIEPSYTWCLWGRFLNRPCERKIYGSKGHKTSARKVTGQRTEPLVSELSKDTVNFPFFYSEQCHITYLSLPKANEFFTYQMHRGNRVVFYTHAKLEGVLKTKVQT